MNGFLPHLKGQLRYNSSVAAVSPSRHTVFLRDGSEFRYEHLISTMPLPVLIQLMRGDVPREIRTAAAALQHVSVRCVHLGIGREHLTEKHWIYYPDRDVVFYRIGFYDNIFAADRLSRAVCRLVGSDEAARGAFLDNARQRALRNFRYLRRHDAIGLRGALHDRLVRRGLGKAQPLEPHAVLRSKPARHGGDALRRRRRCIGCVVSRLWRPREVAGKNDAVDMALCVARF